MLFVACPCAACAQHPAAVVLVVRLVGLEFLVVADADFRRQSVSVRSPWMKRFGADAIVCAEHVHRGRLAEPPGPGNAQVFLLGVHDRVQKGNQKPTRNPPVPKYFLPKPVNRDNIAYGKGIAASGTAVEVATELRGACRKGELAIPWRRVDKLSRIVYNCPIWRLAQQIAKSGHFRTALPPVDIYP